MRALGCMCFLGFFVHVLVRTKRGIYVGVECFFLTVYVIFLYVMTIAIGRFVIGVHGLYHRMGLTETIPQ